MRNYWKTFIMLYLNRERISVVHLDARPAGDQEVAGSSPAGSGNISFVEIDHEIYIFNGHSLSERQLSVSGEECEQTLFNRLED